MKKLVSIIASLIVTVCIGTVSLSAYTTNLGVNNKVLNNKIYELCNVLISPEKKDISNFINNNIDLFTQSEINSILNEELEIDGSIYDFEIYYTEKEYSSTCDTVIIADLKVIKDNGYNSMYLIEMHVNKDGKIYGHNVWAY